MITGFEKHSFPRLVVTFGHMGSGLPKIVVYVILLTCLLCVVSEAFDRWDNSFQTGSETESSVLILALSLGTAYLTVKCSLVVARDKS